MTTPWAYIGSYAPRGGGIHALNSGAAQMPPPLAGAPLVADPHSPTWLCIDPIRRRLHAVHELYRRPGDGHGLLSSYAITPEGGLQWLCSVDSGGCRPVHLSLHPDGRHAFVAHYDSADISVLPLSADGRLEAPCDLRATAEAFGPGKDDGCGPAQAASAPRRSFACSGHEAPHAHMALPDPSGRFLLATDLGRDALIVWHFNADTARLHAPRHVRTSPGAGPRHLLFRPGTSAQAGQHRSTVYLLNEEASTLAWLDFDSISGRLELQGEASCLPPGFAGTSYASDLVCSPDGRHLYALNRLHDSIAHFRLAPDGRPQLEHIEWCRGSYPRTLQLSPCGRRLVVCNERSDHLAWFTLDDGQPRFSGHYTGVGAPAIVVFAPP